MHNARCLPHTPPPPPPRKSPNPFLYTHFLRFLLGRLLCPGEIGNNGYAKCWGVNKVHYFTWKWCVQWIAQLVYLMLIHRVVIYPVDSAIYRFNNRCQTRPQWSLIWNARWWRSARGDGKKENHSPVRCPVFSFPSPLALLVIVRIRLSMCS